MVAFDPSAPNSAFRVSNLHFYGPKWQLNTNPRDGVLLKWTELYNSSVLVFFCWFVRSDLTYARWFATISRNTVRFFMDNDRKPNKRQVVYGPKWQLNTNPRDGVSLKWKELYNSSVLVSFFLLLSSDLAYARWFATIIRNTFFTGNDQTHQDPFDLSL